MTVTFRLQAVLDAAGISQSELSRRSGVSFATINRMCTNATGRISLDVLDRLCATLGVDPGELLEREQPREKGSRRTKGK